MRMQFVAAFANPCACVHALASHVAKQLSSNPPSPPEKQFSEQVRICWQVAASTHAPQSAGQVLHVSPSWQRPSPHTAHEPQSAGQEMHVSFCAQ